MKRLICLSWIWLILLAIVPRVDAGPLPAPKLTPGKFVYSIPADFDPPLIGRSGMNEIQKSASKLHYPYYVVLVKDLPASLINSTGGDEDEAAARAIDGLAEDWQNAAGHYDVGKSSIFLLAYNPRKYRFLAGATWKTKLGFERDAHRPYTEIFERSVQGTPKDPKTGIIEMMQAVDSYLFDHTDPARIAARKAAEEKAERLRREAEQKAERIRRLEGARLQLDEQIARTQTLLQRNEAYLPPDVRKYRTALDNARRIRLSSSADKLTAEANSLQNANYSLEKYIRDREDEAYRRDVSHRIRVTGLLAALVLLLFLSIARWRQYRRLRSAFETAAQAWEQKLLNAKAKYADFYGNERCNVIGLSDMAGQTKELFDRVTADVDAVYLGVEAMEAHVSSCRVLSSGASFARVAPLRKAIADLEDEFEFDTGKLDSKNLFGPLTKVMNIKPSQLSQELEVRFATTITDWEYMKRAAKAKYQPAEELFTATKLDEMLKLADEFNIPHNWISDHPLFGPDEEDRTLYDKVNASRQNDPVAFMRQIDELAATEKQDEDRLNRLVAAVKTVKACRLDGPPQVGDTELAPQDDPRVMFELARREDERFTGMVAARSGVDGAEQVEAQSQHVQKLYRSCAEQAATVRSAIEDAGTAIEQAASAMKSADDLAIQADARDAGAKQVHSDTHGPDAALQNGRRFLESGRVTLDAARVKLDSKRHLEARKDAWQSADQFKQAADEFNQCLSQCDELDKQKALYEQKLVEMDSIRRRAESRIRQYGRSAGRLGDFTPPISSGPANYLLLMAVLAEQEQNWNAAVREAQREYDAEQARLRAEREREEEERRRSSWGGSSSSGGGWSGGGSSSSGGSWGGGSSSSSSSGGSW